MLLRLAGSCSDGVTCPTVWGERPGAGEPLPPTPEGEVRNRVPRSILEAALAAAPADVDELVVQGPKLQ